MRTPARVRRSKTRAQMRFKGHCECCAHRHELEYFQRQGVHTPAYVPGTDLNEVIRRGEIPKAKQETLFMPGNVLFLCRRCHMSAPWAFHRVGAEAWALPLLLIVRTDKELDEFIRAYRTSFKLDHPVIRMLDTLRIGRGEGGK